METELIIVALSVRISILATACRETEYVEADCTGIKKTTCKQGGPYVPLRADGVVAPSRRRLNVPE